MDIMHNYNIFNHHVHRPPHFSTTQFTSSGRICLSPGRSAFQYVNLEWSGGCPAPKRGSAARFFGGQSSIRHWISTKFGILMGTMVPHQHPNFFRKRPPDGGEIEYARYFWMRHAAHVPESKRVGTILSNLGGR